MRLNIVLRFPNWITSTTSTLSSIIVPNARVVYKICLVLGRRISLGRPGRLISLPLQLQLLSSQLRGSFPSLPARQQAKRAAEITNIPVITAPITIPTTDPVDKEDDEEGVKLVVVAGEFVG